MYPYPAGISSREDVEDYDNAMDEWFWEREAIAAEIRHDASHLAFKIDTATPAPVDPWTTCPYITTEDHPF